MARLKIAYLCSFLFNLQLSQIECLAINLPRYDTYDIVYDDYDELTRTAYSSAYQGEVSICNNTIDLPSLSLRTLQKQIIPYWFKYMVALHDSRFHTFSSHPAKHSLCCAWDFYECNLRYKAAGQSSDIREEINMIEPSHRLAYAAEHGGSLCCKSRYKKCKDIVSEFSKELEISQAEEVAHLTKCSQLVEGFDHEYEIQAGRVVKIRIAFRLFTKDNPNKFELMHFDGTSVTLEDNSFFNSERTKTLFEVHDWGGWCHDSVTSRSFNRAYASAGHDYNVIAVRWIPVGGYQNLAQGHRQLGGIVVAKFIKNLVQQYGIQMKTVHLVGTGAGVPFIYYIGKSIQNEGITVPGRITAIDAGPGFEYPEWTKDFKSLGNYTEAIHTSVSYNGDTRPGRYPKYQEEPFAHVDFYPNGGYDQLCLGKKCPKRRSHIHGIYYFNESIIAKDKSMDTRFMAWRCGASKDWNTFKQGDGIWKCGFDGLFLNQGYEHHFVPMGEYVMERGRPLDGVYFLRTNGQRPWSYASYDTCSPPCAEGFTCNDGNCLCGSYNGTVCGGNTPSCLTSNNYLVGYDLTSKCRACTKQRFTETSEEKPVQGSCPTSEYSCSEDGSCKLGSCPRPSGWCTHTGSAYQLKDCDGDQIPDHTCEGFVDGKMGVIQSGSNCQDSWPNGECSDDGIAEPPPPSPPPPPGDTIAGTVTLVDANGSGIYGTLNLTQERVSETVHIEGKIFNLPTGVHGFHVHTNGETTNNCSDAGGHFNPIGKNHGSPDSDDRHVGDLGNILATRSDSTFINLDDNIISLKEGNINNILNRAIVIHENLDDFKGASGNAGARIACGFIKYQKGIFDDDNISNDDQNDLGDNDEGSGDVLQAMYDDSLGSGDNDSTEEVVETMYDDTLGSDDSDSANVDNDVESMYDDTLGSRKAQNGVSYDVRLHEWSKWGQWSSCSKKCGSGGTKTRNRACLDLSNNNELIEEATSCLGNVSEMQMSCNEDVECELKDRVHVLSTDGGYSEWIPPPPRYSPCTAKCKGDKGTKSRFRRCNNPEQKLGGKSCKEQRRQGLLGPNTETISCGGTTPYQTEYPLQECFKFPFNL